MSNNDLFGGMFDINGDGKTDIVEEYLQFNYLEEAAKSQETQNYPHRSKRTDRVPHPKQHNIRDFILNCISAVFTCIVLSFLPCIVMWAAIDTYDPTNSAAGVVTTLIFIVGGFFIIAFVSGTIQVIKENCQKMKELNEEKKRNLEE